MNKQQKMIATDLINPYMDGCKDVQDWNNRRYTLINVYCLSQALISYIDSSGLIITILGKDNIN